MILNASFDEKTYRKLAVDIKLDLLDIQSELYYVNVGTFKTRAYLFLRYTD